MKTKLYVLLFILLCLSDFCQNKCMAQWRLSRDMSDVSQIDTLWPIKSWSIYIGNRFPYAKYSDSCEQPECVIKGFTVDDRERFYVLGGENMVSIACYDGEHQVWKRDTEISLEHSMFALMKVKGDSIYFLDEDRFRMWRMHRDGHGKTSYVDIRISPEDSLAWGYVYDDRFRLYIGHKREMRGKGDVRTLGIDLYFDLGARKLQIRDTRQDYSCRMYEGDAGGEVLVGYELGDCVPFYVRTAAGDTIREVKFLGAPPFIVLTSISAGSWGTFSPPTLFARVGNWLYIPGILPGHNVFFIRKYDARILWRWKEKVEGRPYR